MSSFYQNWLQQNKLENEEALKDREKRTTLQTTLTPSISTTSQKPTTSTMTTSQKPKDLQSVSHPDIINIIDNEESDSVPAVQSVNSENAEQQEGGQSVYKSPTDIVYENDKLELIVQKTAFQRQKRFRLMDHHFNIKLRLKNLNDSLPFLKDILDFLQEGLQHVFENLKSFYNEKDSNLGFITLFQEPMIVALNSGNLNKVYIIYQIFAYANLFLDYGYIELKSSIYMSDLEKLVSSLGPKRLKLHLHGFFVQVS
jgi:hypothetical protein